MKGLCSYCSRYFFCSKRPKQNEEDVILCSSFTQNNDNEENIWEQRRYEIAKDVAAGLVQRLNSTYDSVVNSAIKIADKLIERLKEIGEVILPLSLLNPNLLIAYPIFHSRHYGNFGK